MTDGKKEGRDLSDEHNAPCTDEKMCPGMRLAIGYEGGIDTSIIYNMKTGKGRSVFTYRKNRKQRPLMLTFCPWCGVRVDEPKAVDLHPESP